MSLKLSASGALGAIGGLLRNDSSSLVEFSAGVFPADLFVVRSFAGREAMSELYAFEIDLLVALDDTVLQAMTAAVLRQPARLKISGGAGIRAIHGIVSKFQIVNVEPAGDQVRVRATLVPSLWLAGHRRNTRIFQNLRPDQIVDQILAEWKITASWQLKEPLANRTYCTQYRETDLAFVRRLMAEEGVFFSFAQPPIDVEDVGGAAASMVTGAASALGGMVGGAVGDAASSVASLSKEAIVFSDHVETYPPIADSDPLQMVGGAVTALAGSSSLVGEIAEALTPSPALTFDPHTDEPQEDRVYLFSPRVQVLHESTLLGDYDFRRPLLNVRAGTSTAKSASDVAQATVQGAASGMLHASLDLKHGFSIDAGVSQLRASLSGALPPLVDVDKYRYYEHDDLPEDESDWLQLEADKRRARTVLEQLRAEAQAGDGRSWCHRLEAGHRFRLDGHPLAYLNADYLVTEVVHRFDRDTEQATGELRSDGRARAAYFNQFKVVSSSVRFRPAVPPRALRQVMETATVVGPPGEEIHVDLHGRIKVQFHWDLEGGRNEHSSCWIRTAQSWSGAGWGTQYIPRIGMEVLVTFLNGNPDRPLVVACLPNAIMPPAFPLPEDATRNGLRTQSSPGGDGFNELSFEDRAGLEQIYLRAQRDLDEVVLRDHTERTGRDQLTTVGHDQKLTVVNDQIIRVEGNQTETVVKDRTSTVEGQEHTTVQGNAYRRVEKDLTTRVEGRERREVVEQADQVLKDDLTFRIEGCFTTIVGKHDAKRSAVLHVQGSSQLSSVDDTEIVSDKRIVLRCGESQILIGPKSIEIQSPTIQLKAADASMAATAGKLVMKTKEKVSVESKKIVQKSDGASLFLTKNALLDGTKVKLNCGPDSDDNKDEDKPKKPTTIELKDKDGKPIPYQRFLVTMADGTEVSGVVDHEGKCSLDLEEGGKITFPDLSEYA